MMAVLENLVAELEARFPVGEHGVSRTAVTGEKFVTFTVGGAEIYGGKRAGQVWCGDVETAISLLRLQIFDYAAARAGTLYWRVKPEIDETDIRVPELRPFAGNNSKVMHVKRPVYVAYARLLISDKAVLA